MRIVLDPHAALRAAQRGCTVEEIEQTIGRGVSFPARRSRTGFRYQIPGSWHWNGRVFDSKQIEAYAVEQPDGWLVVTVITRYGAGAI